MEKHHVNSGRAESPPWCRVDPEDHARRRGDFLGAWPHAVRGLITGRHPLADFCACALERKRIEDVIAMAGAS